MTQEEASKILRDMLPGPVVPPVHLGSQKQEAIRVALAVLRGPSREQVERMRGEWIMKHRHRGGFRRATGVDDMGEQHTITIDERYEYDDRYCSKCGKQSPDNFLNFCGYCGAPMTDEAVDMMLEGCVIYGQESN